MNTPFGNPVPVYDMERTICDLIRSRSGIEMQTFQDALKQYTKRKDKDLRKLMRYAQMFRVEKTASAVFGGAFMIKTARQLKDLIRNLSKDKSADAQILMRNYMMERFSGAHFSLGIPGQIHSQRRNAGGCYGRP